MRPRVLVALALGLVGFTILGVAYDREPLAALDQEVAEWVARDLPPWAEWVARPPSWIGGWVGLTMLGIAAAMVLVRERAWLDGVFLLTAFLGSQLFVAIVKTWFDRPRPDVGSVVPLPSSSSFPSGHATAGAASLGALAVLGSERLPSHRARVWLWLVIGILGFVVGLSRIALGVHYVTDVLAGWCLGIAWLAGCLLMRDAVRRRALAGRPMEGDVAAVRFPDRARR